MFTSAWARRSSGLRWRSAWAWIMKAFFFTRPNFAHLHQRPQLHFPLNFWLPAWARHCGQEAMIPARTRHSTHPQESKKLPNLWAATSSRARALSMTVSAFFVSDNASTFDATWVWSPWWVKRARFIDDLTLSAGCSSSKTSLRVPACLSARRSSKVTVTGSAMMRKE